MRIFFRSVIELIHFTVAPEHAARRWVSRNPGAQETHRADL